MFVPENICSIYPVVLQSIWTPPSNKVTPVGPDIVEIPAKYQNIKLAIENKEDVHLLIYFGSALGSIGLFLAGTAVELNSLKVSSKVYD